MLPSKPGFRSFRPPTDFPIGKGWAAPFSRPGPHSRPFGAVFLALVILALPAAVRAGTATQYYVNGPLGGNYSLVTNPTGIAVTFVVSAVDAGGNTDNTYVQAVTVNFHNTTPPNNLSDPQALIENKVPIDASASTGTAVVNFNAGVATIGALLRTGATSEQMWLQDGVTPLSLIYPQQVQAGKAFHVIGFSTQYYLQDANMDNSPAVYSPGTTSYDNLIQNAGALLGVGDVAVTLPVSASVTNAAAYAVTGINGGYAQAGAPIIPSLWFQKPNGAGTSPVSFWVILDYGNDPSGPLTDYSNPTTYETVYSGGAPDVAPGPSNWTSVGSTGPEPSQSWAVLGSQPFMTNGQVIVRVWAPNAGTTVFMRYQSTASSSLSSITVPYSSQNTQPVKGVATPGEFLNGASATLNYIINNPSFAGITFIRFDIPADASAASQWNFTSVPSSVGGYPGSTVSYANPANGSSTPGGVTITFPFSDPMTIDSAITLSLSGTACSSTTVLSFGNMAVTASGLGEPSDSSSTAVTTLGAPSTPASLTAAPVNYTGTGGQVSLVWPQITDQGANGYVISRRSPAGSGVFGALVTIGSNATTIYTDTTAVNLTSYDYTVAAKNDVTASNPVTSNAVTAFANPGTPGPVTALTGGSTIQLSWSAPSAVPGSYAVTGYQIWRDTQASMATAVSLTSTASASYNDTPLAGGPASFYYYAIASADSQYSGGAPGTAHISAFSVTVSGNPPGNPPSIVGTPTLLSSSPATLQLNWNGPSNVLNTPLAGYEVSRAVNAGGFAPLTFLASAASPASIYDTAVTPGNYYVYEVQAVDSLGVTSNVSNAVTGRVGPPPPATPTANPSGTGVTLVWPAVANSVGETVVNYIVNRSSSTIASPVTTAAASMTYTDSGITAGTDYYYQVAAVDQNGVTGGFSGAVTSALLPPAPAALGVSLNLASDNVAVTWATPSPAEANLQQYSLTHAILTATPTVIATPGAASVSFLDASITSANAGATVVYNLTAQNDLGGVGASSSVSLVVPPNAPGGLGFSSSSSAITLTWGAVAGQGVTGYTVYRTTLPAGTPTVIATPTGAAVTDNGPLVQGTNYAYYVTASNGGGAGLGSSPVTAALLLPAPSALGVSLNLATDNVAVTWATPSPAEPNLQQYSLTQAIGTATPTVIATPGAASVSYFDASITSADAGQTITYTLSAQNSVGGTGASASVNLVVPPNAPGGLAFTASASAVTLSWGAIAGQGVTGYTVYRTALPAGTPVAIATPASAAYTDNSPSLTQGVSYVYDVTASNGGGAGLPSAGVTAGLAPPPPSGLNVSSIDASNDIGVTWTNVTGASPNATGVSLLSNTTNNSGTATATSLAASAVTYNYAAQTPDTTYYYWLETVNPFGTSALTSAASTLTYPASVSIVSAALDADGTSRDLTWVPVGGVDVTQYNIYRELVGGGSGFVSVGSIVAAAGVTTAKRTSPVQPGAVYIYKMTAVNATGEGTSQNQVTIGIAPASPVSVTAVSGVSTAAAVSLSWSEQNAVAQGVTAYTVYRATVLAGPYGVIASGVVPTNYLDTSVSGATVYYYQIQADDNNNQSSPVTSTLAVTVTAYALPNEPPGLTDTDGTGQIALNWGSTGVATTYPITGYNIYQSTSAGVTGVVVNATPIPGTSYTATGLTNGTAYYFSVQAVDNQGHAGPVTGQLSDTPVTPPAVPVSVGASPGFNQDQVSWLPGAVPAGSLPVSYFIVQRVSTGPTVYFQVPATLTGYLDTSASNGTTYTYSVEAVDSNTAGVTTGVHVSGFSASAPVSTGQITINPPSNVSAIGGVGQVKLQWTDSVGSSLPVTGYQVYRSTTLGSGYSAISGAATVASQPNGYTDSTGITNGSTYYYYLIALAGTNPSASSATVFASPATAPGPPVLNPTLDGGQENLSWAASPPEGAVTIAQYYVVSSVNGAAAATIGSTTGPVTTYTDGTVSAGQTVVYQVGAVNSNGTTGVVSSPVTAYPYAPMTITSPASTDSAAAVTLTWVAPGTMTWGPLTYTIVRTTMAGGSPTTIVVGSSTSYTDPLSSALLLGQTYLYTITATDAKGHVSVTAGPVTDGPLNPPAAPTPVIATAGNQQILIDWAPSAPVSDSLPVSEYQVTLSSGAGTTVFLTTQTSYLDSGLINGTAVTAVVQAVDTTGNLVGNHLSQPVTGGPATTSAALFNPPTGAAVTATGPNTNVLTWTRPNDEGYIVTSYNIYRYNSFTTVLGSPLVQNLTNNPLNPVTIYTDNGVSPNTTYYYVITANYQQGASTVASPPSNHAFDKTPAPAAGVPPVTTGVMAFDANLLKPLTGQVLSIYFVAPNSGPVEIDVYNVSANPIRALYGTSTAGAKEVVTWDGKDRNGNTVASGIYMIEIKAPGLHQVKKVLVVK